MREGELIRIHKDLCINKIIVGRNQKQYYEDNSNKLKQYKKQYYIDHTDKIKQYQYQYQIDNDDKMKQYRLNNAEKIKQYRHQYQKVNADKKKQYNKQYHLNKKTPKINIAKEDYDLFVYCDKLMNLQYSYKKFIIV